jgi:hypothetical protein
VKKYSFNKNRYFNTTNAIQYDYWTLQYWGKYVALSSRVGYIRRYDDDIHAYWIYCASSVISNSYKKMLCFKTLKEAKAYLMALYVLKGVIEP